MLDKVKVKFVFDIPVASITMEETVEVIEECIKENKTIQHVVINAGKVVAMQSNEDLAKSVFEADLINADGQAVVWASKVLGTALPERVAGIDLMYNLIDLAAKKGYKCYFLGAKNEVLQKVVEYFSKKYSKEIVAGSHDGYFKPDQEEAIAQDITDSGAHMLFVAISSPKKELFVNKYKKLMNVPFVMGVGGSFDVVSGFTKRAPLWVQQAGLEWFHRLLQEPGRMWKRYLVGNVKFILLTIKFLFKR